MTTRGLRPSSSSKTKVGSFIVVLPKRVRLMPLPVGVDGVDNTTPAEREAIRAAVEDGAPAVPVGEEHEGEMDMTSDGYMSTREAAAYLKLSPRTLQSYRVAGNPS